MINFSYKLVHLRIIWDRSVSSWLVDDQHSILFRMPTNLALRGPLRSVTCEMPPRHPMASHRQQLKPIYSLWRVGQPGYCFCVFRSEFFAWATAADHVPNSNCNQARWPPRLLFPPVYYFLLYLLCFFVVWRTLSRRVQYLLCRCCLSPTPTFCAFPEKLEISARFFVVSDPAPLSYGDGVRSDSLN